MYYSIILFSFMISTIISVLFLKKKSRKLWSMLIAFGLNTVILAFATWLSYYIDEEERISGIGQSMILIFAIPIVTWVNFFVLTFVKSKGIKV
ncbi:hypothetical protein F9U64_15540 [Gracilibacillus oryzae]|uniref:Uncharacterized protein n=1 Tax=Gracilibacillus oryzae TaxID=1672701 RepID=A0A7C8GSJ6_9BACI|nr:hypothetical protein [Gracilibacillus oryzae]KAB8129197.1 hypothetical protein F9U64_15540 [Gracilibacillus oryzae]